MDSLEFIDTFNKVVVRSVPRSIWYYMARALFKGDDAYFSSSTEYSTWGLLSTKSDHGNTSTMYYALLLHPEF